MEIAQSLVASAYQSLGYYIIQGVKVGVREIDILAIKLDKNSHIKERLHIEVQISVNPKGVLRGKAGFGKSHNQPDMSAREYINKKFNHKRIIAATKEYFCGQDYTKVLVYGKLKEKKQLLELKKHKIQTVPISRILKLALAANPTQEFKRIMGLFSIIKLR